MGRLLDGNVGSCLAQLVKDGDLILLIDRMLRLRSLDTVRITEVKGHADEGLVRDGRFVNKIDSAIMQLMRRLTLDAGGLILRLLMLAATLLEFVPGYSDTASLFYCYLQGCG